MSYDPNKHHRRSIRLPGFDYRSEAAYFITIVVHDRQCLLGDIASGEMRLNRYGAIANECWQAIPNHFANVELDAHVVMPNHVHGIIIIAGDIVRPTPIVGARHAVPLHAVPLHAVPLHAVPLPSEFGNPIPGSLATIIRSYKSAVTKRINEIHPGPKSTTWQRNYYEHVIRTEAERHRIRQYIIFNPAHWDDDREFSPGQK
jgi:putative transposase